jgi:toxin HigB-1
VLSIISATRSKLGRDAVRKVVHHRLRVGSRRIEGSTGDERLRPYGCNRMIKSFRHRGLQRLFERGDRSKVRADFVDEAERVLARLDAASGAADMAAPGFGLHALTGDRKDLWPIVISRNWRLIFRFDRGDAFDVDFVDYY